MSTEYEYLVLDAGQALEDFFLIASKISYLPKTAEHIVMDLTAIACKVEQPYTLLLPYVAGLGGETEGRITPIECNRLQFKVGDLGRALITSAEMISMYYLPETNCNPLEHYQYSGMCMNGVVLGRIKSIFER